MFISLSMSIVHVTCEHYHSEIRFTLTVVCAVAEVLRSFADISFK